MSPNTIDIPWLAVTVLTAGLIIAGNGYSSATSSGKQNDALQILQQARATLQQSHQLQQESKQLMQRSQTLRVKIKSELAAAQKEKPVGAESDKQNAAAEDLALSRTLQAQGSEQRAEAARLQTMAAQQFAQGLRSLFSDWVDSDAPIRSTSSLPQSVDEVPVLGAHNSAQRSTHPRKQALAGAPQISQPDNMSLQLPKMAAQDLPASIDIASFTVSREREYLAHIAVVANGQPSPDNQIEINTLHSWYLVLADTHGQAIADADIQFAGHMPGHVHGLPTQPRVTQQPAAGVYLIEGIKFQMSGWWVIDLNIDQGRDNIRFNLNL